MSSNVNETNERSFIVFIFGRFCQDLFLGKPEYNLSCFTRRADTESLRKRHLQELQNNMLKTDLKHSNITTEMKPVHSKY